MKDITFSLTRDGQLFPPEEGAERAHYSAVFMLIKKHKDEYEAEKRKCMDAEYERHKAMYELFLSGDNSIYGHYETVHTEF